MKGTSKVRILLRVVGIAVVVALAGLLALRWQWRRDLESAEAEFRARLGPTDVAAYASPAVPDDQNAAIWLRAGARALVFVGNDRKILGEMMLREVETWTPEQRRRLEEFISRSQPALMLVRRAVGLERSSFGLAYDDLGLDDLKDKMPLLELLWIARLLNMQAREAIAAGSEGDFLAATAPMPVLASALERESPFIAGLIGIASEKIFLDTVHEAVRDTGASGETLARLESMLPEDDLRAAWRRTLAAELLGNEPRVLRNYKPSLRERMFGWAYRDRWRASGLRWYAEFAESLDHPYGLGSGWFSPTKSSLLLANIVQEMRQPNLLNAAGRYQSLLALRKLARVALALRRGALASGAYPAALAGIAGADGPDPFSGKPLVFERRPDGSARVAIADGDALWRRLAPGIPTSVPYSWELPAPARR